MPLVELLLFGVEDEEVQNRYRGFIEKMCSQREEILKGRVQVQKLFFIIYFSVIIHGTTMVQNGIISIICSCVFFCHANVNRNGLKT